MSGKFDFVVADVASSQPEAEMMLSVLRAEGIECMYRGTNRTFGVGDGLSNWGPQEILVRTKDEQAARQLLRGGDVTP